MTLEQWESTLRGGNVKFVRPENETVARAAVRLVETFEMVPDNAPAYLGWSPTLANVWGIVKVQP